MRTTIDYGIDLGTTNSEIAIFREMKPEVIPNSRRVGSLITPSAVWIDRKSRVRVGHDAYEKYWDDSDNAKIEFKLLMGQGEKGKQAFPASGQEKLPEELSAEVLKSLKADVRSYTGEEITVAVITVPAAFEVDQCDATRKAAELAGFISSPLLQEPVAAALAYGFDKIDENVFWMVYDFGGGTFDAAIIQVRDGLIQVVNHAGDNYLGGQRIDWDIVEKKLIPELTKQYVLTDFRRGDNPDWKSAIAKLKMAAEQAKIEVSRKQQASLIWFDPPLCQDEKGQVVDFEYELTPEDVEEIISPYIARTFNLSKKALSESNLSPQNIEKVIMVGGSSLFPWLRDKLSAELGIPLDFSIDPITVVSQGAAIFAGTQKLKGIGVEVPAGSFKIDLEYEPIGSDTDPPVGGRVVHPKGTSLEDYTIEFVETTSQWRSGKIVLKENGTFMTEVHAETGRKCDFLIELCDPKGAQQQTVPDRFTYTVGVVMTKPILTHSIGVAMANNRPDFFFEKGDTLPDTQRRIHYTTRPVRKGQKGDIIRIPFIEGENQKLADRNDHIADLVIKADDPKVHRDVPVGSDVEITIHIDESRIITSKAYIPILDETFEKVIEYDDKKTETVDELQENFNREKKRFEEACQKARHVSNPEAEKVLERIEQEQITEEVQSLSEASEGDLCAAPQFQNRLVELREAIDDVENAIEWPVLIQEAERTLVDTRQFVNASGEPDEKTNLRMLEDDMQKVIDSGDPELLRRHIEKIESVGIQVALRRPEIWISWLEYCEGRKSSMENISQAEQLFDQARRAINNDEIESLKAAVRQLLGLLPEEQQQEIPGYSGTTIRLRDL